MKEKIFIVSVLFSWLVGDLRGANGGDSALFEKKIETSDLEEEKSSDEEFPSFLFDKEDDKTTNAEYSDSDLGDDSDVNIKNSDEENKSKDVQEDKATDNLEKKIIESVIEPVKDKTEKLTVKREHEGLNEKKGEEPDAKKSGWEWFAWAFRK